MAQGQSRFRRTPGTQNQKPPTRDPSNHLKKIIPRALAIGEL